MFGALKNHIYIKFRGSSLLTQRLIRSTFWVLFGTVISKGLSLLATIVVAKLLLSHTYGELSLIRSTITLFGLFATFGLGVTVTKFISESRDKNPELAGQVIRVAETITLITGLLMASLMILFANLISRKFLLAPHLSKEIVYSSFYLLLTALNLTQTGALAGLELFKKIAKINIVIGLLSFPITILFAYFWKLEGVIWALTLNLLINYILNKTALKKEIKIPRIVRNKKLFKKIFVFSLPLALSEAVFSFSSWFQNYLIISYVNFSSLGILEASQHWKNAILFVPGALASMILSFLSNIQADSKNNFKKFLKINTLIYIIIIIVLNIIVLVFNKYISALYGKSYVGLSTVLVLNTISTLPYALSNLYTQALISIGKTKSTLIVRAFIELVIILLVYFSLIANYSIEEVVISRIIASIFGVMLMLIIINKYIKN